MVTLLDDQVGMIEEVTYGTPLTVTRFYPFLDGTDGSVDPRLRQGEGLRGGSGRRAALAARNYPTIAQGEVTLKAELESKGAGVLLRAGLGSSTVTAITGGSQQLFHPGITGTYLPSFTIQLGKVQNGGTVRPETFRGCTAKKTVIAQDDDGIATIEVTFDAAGYTTATGLATATYASNPTIFDSFQAAPGVGTGAVTVPTTIALGSGPAASTEWRSWKFEIDQKIEDGDWKLGSRGRPTAGMPEIKFSGKLDFDSNAVPDWYVAGTQLGFMSTHTTTETLGAGFTQMQAFAPKIVLADGLPKVKPGELRTYDVKGSVLNDGTNQDLYIVYRTTDTVL